jgi:hypothetical protein
MKSKKPSKPYWEMTTEELAAATAEFDKEFIGDTFSTPSPAEMAQWERAKRKRGRPQTGDGAKVICVTVEQGLLRRSDRMARKLGISRSALVARGLEAVLDQS